MTALKSHQIDAFIARMDPACAAVLVYGPDRGSVSERARAIVKQRAGSLDDPFAIARLEDAVLQNDPGRLEDEARAIPMLGSSRVVWISDGGAATAAAAERYLVDPAAETLVVIEAGNLQKSAKLRSIFEKAAHAVAMPCYADSGRSLDEIIDAELERHGLAASPAARHRLTELLGADRSLTRSELDKLATYCAGATRVEVEDVDAVCGDTSALELDDVVDATFEGNLAAQDHMLQRLLASGTAPQALVAALNSHITRLRRLRFDRDGGASADDAIARARPPVYFARKASLKRQLGLWDGDDLGRAAGATAELELNTRRSDDLVDAIVGRHLLVLARAAAAKRNRTR
jgi:DNA polymerase-3 subunit delta